MAFSFRNLFSRPQSPSRPSEPTKRVVAVGASQTKDIKTLTAFDNSTITYSSELAAIDYDALLRDKQANINTLYSLADYYTDADPIVRGIIKGVYVPFTSSRWYLTCENEKTIELFQDHYKKIRLREIIDDVFLQYYKYNNVYVYIWDGYMMTLPPHKCKIGNTTLNGTPIVDFNVTDIQNEFRERTYSTLDAKGVKDAVLEDILKGYPPEVAKAIKQGTQYATLNPENVFVLQGPKEGWQRYAVPWIASALFALAKKELISKYESALLNIGARPFVHVKYGDPKEGQDMLPDIEQLQTVRSIFSSAMTNNPLAVTNHLAQAEIIQADMKALYEFPLYEQTNADILSAGGIAGIIVNGTSEDGSTFASAQVSMQAASARIESARHEFEEFMDKVNARLVEDIKLVHTNNLKQIPEFHFVPIDMNGEKAFREACQNMWSQGLVSTKTYMETNGYSIAKEVERRKEEASNGTDQTLVAREVTNAQNMPQSQSTDESNGKVGRPKMKDDERNSDPQNSIRSKQSKDAADGDINTE